MKTKFSKRILSLFLAVMMVVTSIPMFALTASAADGKYLFTYFTGNSQSGQQVRFAVSEDGYNFKALNEGKKIITQNLGTKCSRDPYIFQGNDGAYYIICTDMDASGNVWWGNSNSMVIWKSTDLINWTDETIINMSDIVGSSNDVQRCWAPQVYVLNDSEAAQLGGRYMVYFGLASGSITGNGTYLYYCVTDNLLDQSSYSFPQLLYKPDSGKAAIDGDIVYNNGTYYLYYKDESNATICYVKSSSITGPWSDSANPTKILNTDLGLEGCNTYMVNGQLLMLADAYGDGRFVIGSSSDYENFTILSDSSYSINHLSPRHGSVIAISNDQYNSLVSTYGISTSSDMYYYWTNNVTTANQTWLWHSYSDASGLPAYFKTTADVSGYAKVANGNVSFYNCGALLRATDNGEISSLLLNNEFTISFDYISGVSSTGTIFGIYDASTTDYVTLKADGTFTVKGTTVTTISVPVNEEKSYTVSYDGSEIRLYQDCNLVAQYSVNLGITISGDLYCGLGFSDIHGPVTGAFGQVHMSTQAIFNETYYGELLELMDSYVAKMGSGNIYKNMADAYSAYIRCQEAADAYYYGENYSIDLTAEATNLRVAMEGLTGYDPTTVTFNGTAYYCNSVATDGYSGVVYQKKMAEDSSNSYTSFSSAYTVNDLNQVKVALPYSIVLVDSGTNDIYSPVVVEANQKSKTGVRSYMGYAALDSANNNSNYTLEIKQNWTMSKTDYTNWVAPTSSGTVPYSATSDYINSNINNTNQFLYNKLYFTRTGNSNTTQFYNVFSTDDISFTVSVKESWLSGIKYVYYDYPVTGVKSASTNHYVINYNAVKEKYNSITSAYTTALSGKTFADFKENGLSNILTALDNLTTMNVNPNMYNYDADVAAVVSKCAEAIKTAYNYSVGTVTSDQNQDEYDQLRNAIANKVTDTTIYTADSVTEYNKILDASRELMRDVYTNGYNYPSKVTADATALQTVLNPLVELSALKATADSKRDSKIYNETGTEQLYTYASWKNIFDEISTADQMCVDYAEKGKYTTGTGNYSDLSSDSLTYNKLNENPDNQTTVDNENTTLSGLNLIAVDATDRYDSFDAAYEVANSVDMAKYNAAGVDLIKDAIAKAYADVYATAGANAETYNAATGTSYMTADTLLKLTTTGKTDDVTKALLSAINTANNNPATYVNKYSAVIYSGEITDTSTPVKTIPDVYYGESFDYTISETVAEDSIVTWAVTVYANDADLNTALAGTGTPTPVNSQVISTYNGTTIERTANGSMCIQYFIEEGSKTDSTTYKVYNAYGNVIDVVYTTDALDKDYFRTHYADPVLPFYTFTEWNVSAADNGVVKVKPVFNEIPTKTVTVDTNYATISFNKMSGGNAVVGATATITGNSENIYGWAVATGGKYQIVGYGKNYKFNVFADESYVPIIKTESGYQIDGTDLVADMVAGFSNNSNGNLSDDDYLIAKLDAKAPFVYVQNKLVKYKDGETNKVKFYIRVTAGTEADNLAYGIVVDGKKIASTAKNEGGQFYMATKEDNYNNNITKIDAYASYTFQYKFTDSNDVTTVATIATADYAEVK
ncbi:MAG: hypothetical protein ACI4IR_00100 [Eubacterium sp.]